MARAATRGAFLSPEAGITARLRAAWEQMRFDVALRWVFVASLFYYVSQFTVETYCFADGLCLFKQPQSWNQYAEISEK